MKVAILRDSDASSSIKWERACKRENLDFLSIDMLSSKWLSDLQLYSPDFCVGRPPGNHQQSKKIFDEKIFILETQLGLQIFPDYLSTSIYENKRALAWFLESNNILHPKTFCSSNIDEAMKFINATVYPIVGKTLIGASGRGVEIIKTKQQAKRYVERAFKHGIKRQYGPSTKTGNPIVWAKKALNNPTFLKKKLKQYNLEHQDVQKGVVLLQSYIEHDFEWRCVKIGTSYFAYKKLKTGDQASGAQKFEYGAPPKILLDLTKKICEKHNFFTMSIDLFPNKDNFYVNEMQAIFGHSKPYICKVKNKPGRFIEKEGDWIFEPGNFNENESYNLRIREILCHLQKTRESCK